MRTKINFLVIVGLLITSQNYAQYTSKKVKSKHQTYIDSLKQVEYNYKFPILGQGAYRAGFDIPYPAGIMGNFIWMEQRIIIDNMQLGLKVENGVDIPLTPVDFLQFGDNTNTSYTANLRPDIWVFPFLNVYGIFGYGNSHTEVNLIAPIKLQSVVNQSISTVGVGIMGAGGIGPIWFSVDANWTWNKPELLDEATRVNVMGLRFGKTFTFKNKPESNFAVWAGGMRVKMNSATRGQIRLGDAIPGLIDKAGEIVANYDNWYDNVATPPQKIIADQVLTPIVERIAAVDGSSIISYGMDKQVKEMWNGVFGMQYQYNKHWMIRTEAGLIGDRKSFLLSLNYRFLM